MTGPGDSVDFSGTQLITECLAGPNTQKYDMRYDPVTLLSGLRTSNPATTRFPRVRAMIVGSG